MKTTKKDFDRFQSHFCHWQRQLGLTDWRARFYHDPLDERIAACISPDSAAKLVGVTLGFVTDHGPEETARHEALELLMADFEDVARSRYIRPDDIVMARHAVIRRLENLFDEHDIK